MLRAAALAGALILSASCNKSESTEGLAPAAGSASAKPAAGGFSADLAKDLAGGKPAESSGTAGDGKASGASPPSNGSGADKPAVASADKPTSTGDSKPAGDSKPSGDSKPAADGKPSADSSAARDAKPAAGVKPASDPKVAANDVKPASAGDTKASTGDGAASSRDAAPAVASTPGRPAKVPADLAAIKLSLLPNWDRDIGEPGTFQYVVRIKGTQNTKTFTFRYGYEDPKAPEDHERYKKYLQDTHTLTGDVRDRQRGAAWFLEGNDASGMPAFRYIVLYGGKRLICYGSMYKDAESNKLGDDRDQTLIQAKQICETLAL